MRQTNRIILPREAAYVIEKLNSNGFEAYAVGGCVRDGILGRTPGDWDVTTNAHPDRVKEVFSHTVDTGIRHGTVTVLVDGHSIEVTAYRVDGFYDDCRHPANVEFTSSLEEDLRRRDFTMNAIAYHTDRGIVDPFGGMADIAKGLIRTVGSADERFSEDALRMLRAVRFSAQLGFCIHEDALKAIKDNCGLIKNISSERIRDELTKLVVSEHPMRFALLRDTGLLQFILPEFEACFNTVQQNPHHIYNVAVHSLKVVEEVRSDRILRWAALLHDIAKPSVKTTDLNGIDHFYGHQVKGAELAGSILKRLRFDSKSIDKIKMLILNHDMDIYPTPKAVRKAAVKVGTDLFEDLLGLKEGDRKAQAPQYLEEGLKNLRTVRKLYSEIVSRNNVLSLRELAVNGSDLIAMGFKEGPEIRCVLERLFECVLEKPEINNRDILLEIARELSGDISR